MTNIMQNEFQRQTGRIKEMIGSAHRILITSHLGLDADAIGSCLAVARLLKQKGKAVWVNLESDLPYQKFGFLKGLSKIEQRTLLSQVQEKNIDLLFMLDVADYERATEKNSEELEKYLKKHQTGIIVIDHHLTAESDKFDVCLNLSRAAASAELIYQIFIERLGFELDFDIAQSLMAGILGDTGNFSFNDGDWQTTFSIVLNLINQGVSPGDLAMRMFRYSQEELLLIRELLRNVVLGSGYTYSYLTDEFVQKNQSKLTKVLYDYSRHQYLLLFSQNIESNLWGFIVVPDFKKPGLYRVSFRSARDVCDTTVFSRLLGGGGHKNSSACRLKARDYKEALKRVLTVVEKNRQKALIQRPLAKAL